MASQSSRNLLLAARRARTAGCYISVPRHLRPGTTPVKDTMPAWIFPAYPFLVLGPLAAELLYHQPYPSNLNILVGGVIFQGLGWMLALFMYTLYFTRLVSQDLPEGSKRPGMFVAVGPAGKFAMTLNESFPTITDGECSIYI